MEDFLKSLKVVVLKKLCSAYEVPVKAKKCDLIDSLLTVGVDIDEIKEQLEDWETAEQRLQETLENEKQLERDKIELEREKIQNRERERAHELELARMAAQRPAQEAGNHRDREGAPNARGYDMGKFMQPFKEGDMGLYLVNFERVCVQMGFEKETWSLRLMTLLPEKASEVVARLPENEANDYEKVKSSLLKRYRLTAEVFRKKFRSRRKTPNEGYGEFAYFLKSNFDEWVKSENLENDFNKLAQLMCLEQFYSSLNDDMRFWVEERNKDKTIENAAELADEFVSKRGVKTEKFSSNGFQHFDRPKFQQQKKPNWERKTGEKNEKTPDSQRVFESRNGKEAEATETKEISKKHFEKKNRYVAIRAMVPIMPINVPISQTSRGHV